MGRQINFFFSSNDEKKFLDTVMQQGGQIINVKGLSVTKDEVFNPQNAYQFYLVFPDSHVFKNDNGFVSELYSEVIEYDKSIVRNQEISRGRIYVQLDYYNKYEELVKKPDWLKKKFEFYIRWIKNNSRKEKRDYPPYNYIGEEAYYLYKNGYKMKDSPKIESEF